jgi:3-hydroxybutyryl-CoA dehydrogenase
LARALAPDAVLATNTSSLSVEDLAAGVPNPQRVLGLHFFNPATKMALVEVVAATETSQDAIDAAASFVERIGKTAVFVADTPGFIVNRVARPYYLQAMRALDLGVASAEELDALARGAGFRMGPFELMDLIGLDVNLATSESVYERTEAQRLAPAQRQRDMVAQGLLGRKTGSGFYSYVDGKPERFDPAPSPASPEVNDQERVAVVGFGARADEIAEALQARYAGVARVENEELLDGLGAQATIVVDTGDGSSDRSEILAELDTLLGPETVIFADAYATDLAACASSLRHPDRLVGYGILGTLSEQRNVEIVDSEGVSDDALELAQELFAELDKGVVLVEDVPGLFLGRTIGAIVNEAMILVQDDVATPDDIDTAMRLGASYPIGPIAWGREIGGARIKRILQRVADADGEAFAPHRSLWVLDLDEPPSEPAAAQ